MEKKRGRKRKIVTEVTEIVKDEAKELVQDVKKEVSEGLGDTLEKVFKATGVDKVAKWIAGEDCGCDKRKEALNKLFPYRKIQCLTEDEHGILHEFFQKNTYMGGIEVIRGFFGICNLLPLSPLFAKFGFYPQPG